jgi:nucleoside-diphosphate-sugar epimerase
MFLVTGGAGFIGSHLATALVERGDDVRVLDNFATGKRSNLDHIEGKFELMEGDLRVPEDCARACKGVEIVLHQGAVPSVPLSVENPVPSHDANINGTFNILQAARDAGVRRLMFAASSSAYGENPQSPKVETMATMPLSPYAVQKLTGEYYLRVFYECYGLETLALRYFNVFGPRQDPKSQYAAAIPAFVTSVMRGESPTIYGDGEQTRDFSYIDNVVHANLLAADAPEVHGEVVNIACGESISVNQVNALINELLGKDVTSNHVDPRAGDVRHSLADLTLAKKLIGYEPVVPFKEGLSRAIEWYRDHLDV